MLLDTICNTFGGIVFIALLLAIFSQASGTRDRDCRAETQAEIRLMELNAKIVQIQTAIARLEAQLQTQTVSTNKQDLLIALLASNATLRASVASVKDQRAKAAEHIAELRDQALKAKNERAQLVAELRTATLESQQAIPPTAATRRLPRLQAISGHRPVFLAIQDGFLHVFSDIQQPVAYGERGFDHRRVQVETEFNITVLTPKHGAGQFIGPESARSGLLAGLLANVDPRTEYFQIAVDKQSFGAFNYVKQVLVNGGFRYYWIVYSGPVVITKAESLEAM
jgi:hypothetical protein